MNFSVITLCFSLPLLKRILVDMRCVLFFCIYNTKNYLTLSIKKRTNFLLIEL